jgi:hypothetical protein
VLLLEIQKESQIKNKSEKIIPKIIIPGNYPSQLSKKSYSLRSLRATENGSSKILLQSAQNNIKSEL